ncbi:pantoate--beta-alanine ligase [bacterium]|nr:pantoate--beta-alanine ligase [bacterium]
MATPLLLDTVAALRTWRRGLRAEGASLAFVPTMGKLHEGHLDLMRLARKHADQLLVSVFVNPTQFGPGEDYAAYPRDLAADLAAMASLAPEACFAPAATAIYPPGDRTTVSVNWGLDRLCGATRPGHFDGVTNVLARLFNLVEPDTVILGQKDAQQALIVKRMVDALHWPLRLRLAPTRREPDGLAMSSRNAYLSAEQRAEAPALFAALEDAGAALRGGERDPLRLAKRGFARLAAAPGLSPEYFAAVDPSTLEPPARVPERGLLLVACAARLGPARLIDNHVFSLGEEGIHETLLF